MVLLLGVELLDELVSGIPSVGSATIQDGFGASYTVTAWALLLGPGLFALCVEPFIFVLADRHPRKWFVAGGLLAMAVSSFAAALAPNVLVLSAALAISYVGSGSSVALSQATLVDARPHDRERVLTRWALLGEIGDLVAPAIMALLALIGLGWRAAYGLVGAMLFVWALALARLPMPSAQEASEENDHDEAEPDDDEEEPGLLDALRAALQNRALLFWLGAAALCDLLDEIVVVFGVLHLRDNLHASPIASSVVVGCGVAGAIAGVLLTDRLLTKMDPLRLLLLASVGCTVSHVGWLLAPEVVSSAVLFFAVGVTAAPMYPLASAQAYAALPGRSGTVNAAAHVFTPFSLGLPWLLGAVADYAGARAALVLLLAQPVGLAVITLVAMNRRPKPP